MNRFFRSGLLPLILIVLVVYLVSSQLMGGNKNEKKVTYSQLREQVENDPGSVEKVVFSPSKQEIKVDLADGKKLKVNYPTPSRRSPSSACSRRRASSTTRRASAPRPGGRC